MQFVLPCCYKRQWEPLLAAVTELSVPPQIYNQLPGTQPSKGPEEGNVMS